MSREEAERLIADIERAFGQAITATLDERGIARARGDASGYSVALLLRRERRMIRVLTAEDISGVLDAWHAFLPSHPTERP